MKIACIADNHGFLNVKVPECDLMIIAGDICPVSDHSVMFQKLWIEDNFINWARKQPVKNVVWVAGNHDFICQTDKRYDYHHILDDRDNSVTIHYVNCATVKIDDLNIWGSPWSNEFGPWAFMTNELQLERIYEDIPENIDVIISHGPPKGLCDFTEDEIHAGSSALRRTLSRVKPRLCVTGHIHEGYGVARFGDTKIINASIMTAEYQPTNKPIMVEI